MFMSPQEDSDSPQVPIMQCGRRYLIDREKIVHYTIVIITVCGVVMEQRYYLYLGKDTKEFFSLPETWTVSHFVEAEEREPLSSIEQMVLDALSQPAGTDPLPHLVSKADRIAIIVDDGTRPTPVAPILSTLLSNIEAGGFEKGNITIVIALGTHEAMAKESLEARLGSNTVTQYRVIQHNAWQSDLVPVVMPGDRRVLKINPEVARADLRIGISSILPHPMAGYGGGPKIVMPGVANYEFIRDHHMKHLINPHSTAGLTKGNPFHEDCMKAARAIGLDFSINCVYDQKGRIIRIIGGSLDMAFTKAVEVCLAKLGHQFEQKVDVTIASAYPHSHGHQFFKGLSAPDAVTKETGAILLMAPIVAPLSTEFMNSFHVIKEKSKDNSAEYIKDHLSRGMAYLPDKSIDFNMAMSTPFLRPKIRTILVSPLISENEARTMGLDYASSVEDGIKLLEAEYTKATVAVFPAGGLIIPITAWER
jgi:lactate racemase